MLRRNSCDTALTVVGAIAALMLASFSAYGVRADPSQRPPTSAREQSGPIQNPADTGNHNSSPDNRGTEKRPLVVEAHSAPESEAEASKDAEYQERKTADEAARNIGVASIVVGALQTIALFITFMIIAYVAVRQLRAYVYPNVFLSEFSLTEPIEFCVVMKNCGATPARDFECHGTAFIGALPLADTRKIPDPHPERSDQRHSKAALFPGLEQTVSFACVDALIAPIQEELIRKNPKAAIYVAGEARYRDIFGFKRTTNFCVHIASDDAAKLVQMCRRKMEIPDGKEIGFVYSHILNKFT